jgi:glycosyltransferase involved in cell wall biosynthesis
VELDYGIFPSQKTTMAILSIIIPVYNEQATLEQSLNDVIALNLPQGWEPELIIVNDASQDSSQEIISSFVSKYGFVKSLQNESNLGKSQTVKKGIMHSTGDLVIIRDADLEYAAADMLTILNYLIEHNLDVVYGNRFGKKNKVIYWQNYIGNRSLSAFSNIFTFPRIKTWLPDMEVCYKLIDGNVAREVAKTITSKSNFGIEPEITAKLSRYKKDGRRLKFGVVPISYFPRSIAEGKKMKAVKDGLHAAVEIIKFNLLP